MTTEVNTEVQPPAPQAPEAGAPQANLNVGAPTPPQNEPAPQPIPFAPTGDAALDVALDFFGKAGLKPTDAAMVLAQKGDFSVLKAELASKGKQGWEAFVGIAEQAHGRAASATAAKTAATQAAILSITGDQAAWDAIRTFVGSKADAGELESINAAIKAGGFQAKAAVKYMKDVYLASGQALPGVEKGDPLPSNRARNEVSGGPMTAAEYNAAVQELSAKIGSGRVSESKEYAALKARRLAAMG